MNSRSAEFSDSRGDFDFFESRNLSVLSEFERLNWVSTRRNRAAQSQVKGVKQRMFEPLNGN